MKISFFLPGTLAALALAFPLLNGKAAQPTNAEPPATVVSSNAVPLSVFSIPVSRTNGCDPFYPSSTRLWASAVTTNNVATQIKHVDGLNCLVLKGLSGAAGNPLAMINGRTMSRGEDAEINTDCGRLSVHCVDISSNSVVIEVAGERRELHLRSDL
jgi:hypothetical protein